MSESNENLASSTNYLMVDKIYDDDIENFSKNTNKHHHHQIMFYDDGNNEETKSNKKQDENERDQWGGQMEFLLACLGNAVGLGNCWRFPYLCYKNGGGAFLVPYMVCCLIIGLPLFLIELSLGQYSAMGPGQLWANLSPLFRGVGIASIISSAIVAIYYNMIIAWTLFYLVESIFGQKWQSCSNHFNSEHCFSILSNNQTATTTTIYSLPGPLNNTTNMTMYENDNILSNWDAFNRSISSTEEFFNEYILTKSNGFEDITMMNWKLVGALFVSWILVSLALIKGIQSSGKVVYFTATFPYVILTILLARGVSLPGSIDGLSYYLIPRWDRIYDVEVWRDAAVQVFYSFGIGGGGMITYASYNRFHNPVTRHALLVGIGDFLTSIFCGAVVFTMIGYMAWALNKPIEQIVQDGAGLAFIVIPEGLARMPVSVLWSILFFSMLFLLGIDSQFAMVETVITYLFDKIRSKKLKVNKPLVVSATASCWFIVGLPLCTDAGIYFFTMMDHYSVGIPCLVIGLVEIFIITFVYGLDQFFDNLEQMTKWRPKILLKSHIVVMISVVAPAVLVWILYGQILSESMLTYGSYQYPHWSKFIGWSIAAIPICVIPLAMIQQFFLSLCCPYDDGQSGKTLMDRIKMLIKPTNEWWSNYEKTIYLEKIKKQEETNLNDVKIPRNENEKTIDNVKSTNHVSIDDSIQQSISV